MRTLFFLLAACAVPLTPALVWTLDWVYVHVRMPRPPVFPVRNTDGVVILTYEDWARHAQEMYPKRFILHETLLRSPWRRLVRAVRYLLG